VVVAAAASVVREDEGGRGEENVSINTGHNNNLHIITITTTTTTPLYQPLTAHKVCPKFLREKEAKSSSSISLFHSSTAAGRLGPPMRLKARYWGKDWLGRQRTLRICEEEEEG